MRIKRGFTLIELVVTISILGLIISATTYYGVNARKRTRINRAKTDMMSYALNISQFNDNHKWDFDIAKRWPAASSSEICSGTQYGVPTDLKNEGLGNGCRDYKYQVYYYPPVSPTSYIVTLTWPGIDGKLDEMMAGGKDNYLQVVSYFCKYGNAGNLKNCGNDIVAGILTNGKDSLGNNIQNSMPRKNWTINRNNILFVK